MASDVANRYAEGLFSLALENGTVEEKKDEALCLREVVQSEEILKDFFASVKISSREKKELIEAVFGSFLDQDMIRFLKLLVDKNRVYYLNDILDEFVQMANDELGIQPAVVYSARKLPETDMERLRDALVRKTGKTIQLTNRIDESLIAGIKVVVGNNVTDATVKNQLNQMKRTLLKGGQA